MYDDIREVYDAELDRWRDDAARLAAKESATKGTDDVINPSKHAWEDAYPPEPKTTLDAYADGWMAYCEGEDESPYQQLDLRNAWEDAWADAEDFFGGEPCQ